MQTLEQELKEVGWQEELVTESNLNYVDEPLED